MKPRRFGCLVFGVCWAAVFVFTNIGLALGHPNDPAALDPLTVLFWVEIGVLVVGAILFSLLEQRNSEP